jgi:tight adherence protein B
MLFNNKYSENYEMDYNNYTMSVLEKVVTIFISAIILVIIGYIFYRKRIFVLCLISLFSLLSPKYIKMKKIKKQKEEINIQFQDSLFSLSSSLEVGKSIENAIEDVIRDLGIQYSSKDRIIIEYQLILKKIKYNTTVFQAFYDFANRTGSEDINNFADIFEVTKNIGGNTNKVIRRTARIISDKFEINREIDLLVESKKNEIKLLNIAPIVIILMLSIIAKDYMEPVFTTTVGLIGTTFSLILLIISKIISDKILNIGV